MVKNMLDFPKYCQIIVKIYLFKDSLMKNMSLLILALVIALPGCCKRRNIELVRSDVVEQSADTTGIVINTNETDEDEFDLSDLTDEDLEQLEKFSAQWNLGGVNSDDMEMDEEEISVDMSDDNQEVSFAPWVDAQEDEMKRIYFTFNHYGVREDQKPSLHYNVEQLKQMVADASDSIQPTIVVEGHSDQEGDPSYNIGLSEKRAQTVADLLVASGIDRSLVKVIARGQDCPLTVNGHVVNGSRDDRAPNRRVEVRVIYS
jgi:outer membrane protein OmpA-like peptidoglycan-associated protein